MPVNKQILLDNRPQGEATASNFRLVTADTPPLRDGEVLESRAPEFKAGDKVVGMGGWQEYSVVDAGQPGAPRKVDTSAVPLSYYLGAVGMPGVTAWYGLNGIIKPKAGQTIVVSAASGAVGSSDRRGRSSAGLRPASDATNDAPSPARR